MLDAGCWMLDASKSLPASSIYSLQENEQPDPKGRNIKARDGAKRSPWKDGHSLNQPCKGAISVHLLRPFRAGLEVNEFPGMERSAVPGKMATHLTSPVRAR